MNSEMSYFSLLQVCDTVVLYLELLQADISESRYGFSHWSPSMKDVLK